jgi:hypothetical protein
LGDWDSAINTLRGEIQELSKKTITNDTERDYRGDEVSAEEKRLIADALRLRARLPPQPNNAPLPTLALENVDAAIADVEVRVLALPDNNSLKDELTTLLVSYAQLKSNRVNHTSWVSEARFAHSNLEKKQAELKGKFGEVSRLFGATSSDIAPEVVERVVNVTAELEALSRIWRGSIYKVALWSNDMLVLLLVISMGILGSALHLLAVFVKNETGGPDESLSFGEYPLRLAFGAVTAIVVFIVAKAGIPILADTAKLGGGAPINPYFVSFLAIVSGLMSDRAFEAIRGMATNLLRGGGDLSQRYTRANLDEALKQAGRPIDGLAQVLGLSAEDTKKLFSGRDLVPPDRQRLISAYLNQPVRDLFSDMPAA